MVYASKIGNHIFKHNVFIISDPSFDPSIALASLVQHIPLQMITVLIKSLTTDQNVKDASMTQALCRSDSMCVQCQAREWGDCVRLKD